MFNSFSLGRSIDFACAIDAGLIPPPPPPPLGAREVPWSTAKRYVRPRIKI